MGGTPSSGRRFWTAKRTRALSARVEGSGDSETRPIPASQRQARAERALAAWQELHHRGAAHRALALSGQLTVFRGDKLRVGHFAARLALDTIRLDIRRQLG